MESKTGLSAAEMDVVRVVFQAADDDTAASFMEPEAQVALAEFRWGLAFGQKPYLTVSTGLAEMIASVMGNALLLDYTFDLYGKFVSRWAQSDEMLHALHENLGRAFSMQYPNNKGSTPEANGTHPDILKRLSSKEDIVKLLDNTPWLTVLLLQNVYPNIKIRAATKPNRRASAQDQAA